MLVKIYTNILNRKKDNEVMPLKILSRISFLLFISLLLLTPFIYSDDLYNGVITAKQIWFYGTMALLMASTGVILLFNHKPASISLNSIDIALLIFYIYYIIRAATTRYMPMLHNQRFINWTLCVVLYFSIKCICNRDSVKNINKGIKIINYLILSAFVLAIWGLLQLYGYQQSFNANFKITGTFFNPAPYALYLAIIFPMALWQTLDNKNFINKKNKIQNNGFISVLKYYNLSFFYYLSLATTIAIILVLPATMIRASWLAAGIGSLIVLNYKYKFLQTLKNFLITKTRKIIALTFIVLTIVTIIVGLYKIKNGSSIGKLFIWKVTLEKIAEKPFFGYGVGRFEAEYNNWQAEYFQKHPEKMNGPEGIAAGNTKYAFNEYIEMASETGIVGLLLFFVIIYLVCIEINKDKLKNLNNHSLIINPFISYYLFIPFLIIMAFSFPFYNIPLMMQMFISMGIISAQIENKIKLQVKSSIKNIGLIFMASYGISIIYNQYFNIKALVNWRQANFSYISDDYHYANKLYTSDFIQLKYNGLYVQQYGKSLQMVGDYSKAIDILKNASHITTDNILYCTLGDAYMCRKEYIKAENAYTYASTMQPNQFYPHYLLVKLYEISGQHEKVIEKAKEILTKNVKIKSMAVEEMKDEMKKIIQN